MTIDMRWLSILAPLLLVALGMSLQAQAANYGKLIGNAAESAEQASKAAAKATKKIKKVPKKPRGLGSGPPRGSSAKSAPRPKPNYKKSAKGLDSAGKTGRSPPRGSKELSSVADDVADTPAAKPSFYQRHAIKLNLGLMAAGVAAPIAISKIPVGSDEPDDSAGEGDNPSSNGSQPQGLNSGGFPTGTGGYPETAGNGPFQSDQGQFTNRSQQQWGYDSGGSSTGTGGYPETAGNPTFQSNQGQFANGSQQQWGYDSGGSSTGTGGYPETAGGIPVQSRQSQVAIVRSWFPESAPLAANPVAEAPLGTLARFNHVSQSFSNDQYLFDGQVGSLEACASRCLDTNGCAAFTYAHQNMCTLFPRGTTWVATNSDYQAYEAVR